MSTLRLVTLGGLRLLGPAGELLPGRRKPLVLLAYLASRAPRAVPREELAALLWGEKQEGRARASLRHALLDLRRAVGEGLQVTAREVRLAAGAVALDAADFEREAADGRPGEAAARWGGEFLPGADDQVAEAGRLWIEQERERLRRRLAAVLERLEREAAARGAWSEAAAWAERWCAACPLEERPHCRLVEALRREGRGAEALARHGAFVVRLRREAGVEPSAELSALVAEVEGRGGGAGTARPGSAALFTPDLVGRDASLDALLDAWRSARDGGSAAVLVEGEEGIGKTRLCTEFVRGLGRAGEAAHLLEAQAEEGDAASPWATARRLLAELRRAPGLAGASDAALAELSVLLPSLRERFPALPGPRGRESALTAALLEVLRDVAAEVPLLLVVDDAARADAASQQLLASLLRAGPPSLLLLLAARPDELAGSPLRAHLGHAAGLRRLRLQPLSGPDVETLLDSMLTLPPQPRRSLAARLHAESGGNPGFVLELVAALADRGSLTLDAAGTWRLDAECEQQPLPLPAEIRATTRARLERLAPPARQALAAAAVLGARADAALLQAVAGLAPDELGAALDDLIARRLLRPVGDAPGYEFAREMTRRAVYESIPAGQRQALHAAALAALDRAPPHGAPGDRLRAYHRDRGGPAVREARRRLLARRLRTAAAAVLLPAGAAAAVLWLPGAPGAGGGAEQRVVVDRFANETGDPALDMLGPIVADWLTQGIARTGLVPVAPPPHDAAGRPQRGDEMARARALAEAARATLVVRGAYHVAGDSIYIRSQIVEARRGEVLRAVDAVAAPTASPMAAVETLRQRTLGALAAWVDPRMAASARMQGSPPSYEAYRLFAQGLERSYRRDMESIDYFRRAFALDTGYAAPLLYLASEFRSTGQLAAADSAVRRLLPGRHELTPFERHLLDWHRAWLRGDLAGQYAAVAAAAEIAPGSRMAALQLPGLAISLNLPHRAVELFARVDPGGVEARSSSYWVWYAGALHMSGDFDRQLEIGRLVQERFPEDPRGLSHQARALAALGRLAELDSVLGETLALPVPEGWEPTGFWIHLAAADELAEHGRPYDAARVLGRAVRLYADVPDAIRGRLRYQFTLGQALFRLGRLAEARAVFEALAARDSMSNEMRVAVRAHIGYVAARQGDLVTAREVERWLRAPGLPYLFGQHTEARAVIAGLMGEKEAAVRLLRQATGEGRAYDSSTRARPEFAPLRGYPPFEAWAQPRGERGAPARRLVAGL